MHTSQPVSSSLPYQIYPWGLRVVPAGLFLTALAFGKALDSFSYIGGLVYLVLMMALSIAALILPERIKKYYHDVFSIDDSSTPAKPTSTSPWITVIAIIILVGYFAMLFVLGRLQLPINIFLVLI